MCQNKWNDKWAGQQWTETKIYVFPLFNAFMDKCVREVCGDIIGVLVGGTNVNIPLSADNNVLLAER